jgi:hypothetical protein
VGYVETLSVDKWRRAVSGSNAGAMRKRHQYPPYEGAFLLHCCTWQESTCGANCFCRKVGGGWVWTLRPDLDFETFLDFYADLWIGVQGSSFKGYVNEDTRPVFARWATGVRLLREVKVLWVDWDGRNHSLPELVSQVRRCYFCNDAFDQVAPFVESIQGLWPDSTGVFTSKLLSQLFYDIAVPFDSASKGLQERRGYEPSRYGGGAMHRDVQKWLVQQGLHIAEFRRLDDAPVRYWRADERPGADVGTACSRVLDKLFYG